MRGQEKGGCVATRRKECPLHTANLDKVAPPEVLSKIFIFAQDRGEKEEVRGDCLCSRSAPDLLVAEVQQ